MQRGDVAISGVQTGGGPLLSLGEVAEQTGRNVELLRRWCATGRIACARVGRDWLVDATQLERIAAMPRRGGRQDRSMVELADLGVLPRPLRAEVVGCIGSEDEARVVVVGTEGTALVATDSHILAARDGELWRDPRSGEPVLWPLSHFRRVQADIGTATGALVLTPQDPDDRALVIVLARPHLARAEAAAHALRELLDRAGSYEGAAEPA